MVTVSACNASCSRVIRGIISSDILQPRRVFCDVRHTKLNAFPVRHDKAKSRLLVTQIQATFCKLKGGEVGQGTNREGIQIKSVTESVANKC